MNTKGSKVKIQSIDFKSSRKLSAFVRKHVAKLEQFTDRIVEIRVSLKLDATVDANKIAEIAVAIPGKDLFVSKKSDSFEESVTLCVDALKHQLETWKASISGRKKDFRKSIEVEG